MMMILDSAGIPLLADHERSADEDNPNGYYEFERVKKLKEGEVGWMELAPGRAVKVISALLQYLPDKYHYKVLFMRRALPEILASQRKMLIHRGENPDKISDEEMGKYFEEHVVHVIDWLRNQPNIEYIIVDYNELVINPSPQIKKINLFLGGKLDEDKMKNAIKPDLYRQRSK